MSSNSMERKVAQLDNDVAAIYDLVTVIERRQRDHESKFTEFANSTITRFAKVDERFDGMDKRFDQLQVQLATVIDLAGRRAEER